MGALVLSLSSLAMAEGGGDRTFDRAMQANERAMAAYAAKQGKEAPVVENYTYETQLDIKKVVNVTPPVKSCDIVPSRMTYEDSAGKLNTIEYQVMGQCRTNGS
jgi:hypothetical protein